MKDHKRAKVGADKIEAILSRHVATKPGEPLPPLREIWAAAGGKGSLSRIARIRAQFERRAAAVAATPNAGTTAPASAVPDAAPPLARVFDRKVAKRLDAAADKVLAASAAGRVSEKQLKNILGELLKTHQTELRELVAGALRAKTEVPASAPAIAKLEGAEEILQQMRGLVDAVNDPRLRAFERVTSEEPPPYLVQRVDDSLKPVADLLAHLSSAPTPAAVDLRPLLNRVAKLEAGQKRTLKTLESLVKALGRRGAVPESGRGNALPKPKGKAKPRNKGAARKKKRSARSKANAKKSKRKPAKVIRPRARSRRK